MLSLAPLLIHSDAVPPEARTALRTAFEAPPEKRTAVLKTAARALYDGTDLECVDVLELLGLPERATCS